MEYSKLGILPDWNKEEERDFLLARVVQVQRGHLVVQTAEDVVFCHLGGGFDWDTPSVGDWCLISPIFEGENGKKASVLQRLLPRCSILRRLTPTGEQVLAANVDIAYIVTSVNDDFNVNRLHRYVTMVETGHVEAVIVLSKCDLVEHILGCEEQLSKHFPKHRYFKTSQTESESWLPLLESLKPNKTGIFLGSSGVGKSTLVNSLLGKAVQETQGIRSHDSKGRHTTTSRELFVLSSGGVIIDAPGLKTISLAASESELNDQFSEIVELAKECRYSNCQHDSEPGCAIQQALESGQLDEKLWISYNKFLREAARASQKRDYLEEKRRWQKGITKNFRQRKKLEGKW